MTTLATPMLQSLDDDLGAGVSLIEITSLDNAETIARIAERYSKETVSAYGTKRPIRPMIQWDIARGMVGINTEGTRSLMKALPPPDETSNGEVNVKALTTNPVDALGIAQNFERRTLLFLHNFQLYLGSEAVQQAFWNLRDTNAAMLRCCIAVGPAFDNPPTIAQDVVMLDEPAPSEAILEGLVDANRIAFNDSQKSEAMKIPPLEPAVRSSAALAMLGMSTFSARNSLAVNTSPKGINVSGLWTDKISKIGQTKGMSVYRGDEQIANYVGYQFAVNLLLKLIRGKLRPGALWLWDEIDKDFAGNAGDNTGVSQELHGMLLKLIQDYDIPCLLFGGVWGTGKTELIKSARNSAPGGEIAAIMSSLAAMKSGVVGSSMTAFLTAWKIGMALSGSRPLMIFTANSLKTLSPEFRSRMMVQFFFEEPDEDQRIALWNTYTRKFELPKQELPDSTGWVGREVRKCCKMSSVLEVPLIEAARGIVPQTVASKVKLGEIRREATNSLVDANTGGPYVWKSPETAGGQRAFEG